MSLLYTAPAKTKRKFKPRRAFDFYPTDDIDILASYIYMDRHGFFPETLDYVIDPGAGEGPWGRVLRDWYPDSHITGAEIRPTEFVCATGYDVWRHGDFCTMPYYQSYDLVVGNPPYNIAEDVIRRSMDILNPGGVIAMLLLLNFWSSQGRAEGLYQEFPLKHLGVYVKRPSFTGDGKTDAREYALFIWEKGWTGMTTTGHIVQKDLVQIDRQPTEPLQIQMELA